LRRRYGRLIDKPDPGADVRDSPPLFIIQRNDGVLPSGPGIAGRVEPQIGDHDIADEDAVAAEPKAAALLRT
jgi:hypothetical protein